MTARPDRPGARAWVPADPTLARLRGAVPDCRGAVHPSSVLRSRQREDDLCGLVADLGVAARELRGSSAR